MVLICDWSNVVKLPNTKEKLSKLENYSAYTQSCKRLVGCSQHIG